MTDREQSVRSEAAILEVFDNQFPTLTNQLINNLHRLSTVGEKWPAVLLMLSGGGLLLIAIAIKIGFFGAVTMMLLWPGEFIALILAGSGLILVGGLFSLYQARSLRKIIHVQQALGTELLHKQVDIEKDLLTTNQRQQGGQLILLPAKKYRKRYRR